MASINFNPFGENWFKNPLKLPFQPINLVSLLFKPYSKATNFASISSSFSKKEKKTEPEEEKNPAKYIDMLEQFYWECENLPDYRHTPEVEKILQEDPILETRENPTQEEIKENQEWWDEFRASPVVQFLARTEEIVDKLNQIELRDNSSPYRPEDRKFWRV
ncbi:Protein TIC 56- chloroplastic [Striga hermonthica]|uniref:Protein TIC 56- chloroplastic n=1 Tax=Striga hermonthica TaxID=68872 RepID=A0A9N7NTQ3_STRHE|nr:Protein TIC 56- chloroplastic [Striga hermonthica]